MWPNPQDTADLVAFTGEILDGKLHFLCSDIDDWTYVRRKWTVENCDFFLQKGSIMNAWRAGIPNKSWKLIHGASVMKLGKFTRWSLFLTYFKIFKCFYAV